MKRLILGIFIILGVTACGTGGGNATSQAFFRLWYNQTIGAYFDLSNQHFGTNTNYQITYGNGVCACQLDLNGSIDNGSYSITTCQAYAGAVSTVQCEYLNQTGSYSVHGNELIVCTSGQSQCVGYY